MNSISWESFFNLFNFSMKTYGLGMVIFYLVKGAVLIGGILGNDIYFFIKLADVISDDVTTLISTK